MTATQLGLDEITRSQILDRVLSHTSDAWKASALKGIAELAGTGRTFQAADLKAVGVPDPDHSSRWGSVFVLAASSGLIVHKGYEASRRATVRGSAVKTWVGADAQPVTQDVDRLRALSINRPYADQIMRGAKAVENRSRDTHYRGPLVVHASQRVHYDAVDEYGRLNGAGQTGFVGVVDLVGVCSSSVDGMDALCRCALDGNTGSIEGYFHWQLANPRPFPRALEGKGRLGLFPVPLVVADIAMRVSMSNNPEGLVS